MDMQKIFVVQKYVPANTLLEALKKEKKIAPTEAWMTDHSKNQHLEDISPTKKR